MKKTLLSFATLVLVGIGASQAQTMQLLTLDSLTDLTNTTITVTGDPSITYNNGDEPMKANILVKNLTNDTVSISVRRYILNEPNGSKNWFCWTLCYQSSVSVSDPLVYQANEIDNDFYGDYWPNGVPGTAVMKYTFYKTYDPTDSVQLTVNYVAEVQSVENSKPATLGAAYPNPAKDFTSFEYNLNSGSSGAIQIYDMTGNLVRSKALTESSGNVKMNLEDLTAGVYFYSFVVDGKAIATKRLVVSK